MFDTIWVYYDLLTKCPSSLLSDREMVLARVAALVKKFVHKVMVSRGHTDAAARNAGGKIFTFGSYRLGVHGPGADIDTLCVVPKHVDREDFFTYFEPMLKELDGATEVAVCSGSRLTTPPRLAFVGRLCTETHAPGLLRAFRTHMFLSSQPTSLALLSTSYVPV